MADNDERRRVLDMLAAGSISAEDAANLLKALGASGRPGLTVPEPPPAPSPPRPKGPARLLRVIIDADKDESGGGGAKVRVNVPLSLAKFAMRFMPPEARAELDTQGIDLAKLLEELGDEVPEGRLVDIETDPSDSGKGAAHIVIEVV
ncbi:MAG: hypothetical protein R6W77_02480 [Trueperaceae bacterium]